VTQAGSKIDSCKFYFCKKSENCQLFPPHVLALPLSPTNNAGIATAPLSHYTVEDRGDNMAKGRKILGCLSCLPPMQRGQGQILSLLFWELFEEHLNNLYKLIFCR
jgi:hypothetical protein